MSMKISLFDAEDLKAFEDLLFRAMVRTARVLRKEGLIGDLTLPTAAAAPPPPEPSFLRGPPEQIVRTAETVFRQNGQMPEPQRPPDMPPPQVLTPEQWAAQAKPPRKPTRRSAADVCKTHHDKPAGGWIRTEEAARLMASGGTLHIERAKTMLGQWILDEQVAGVIVTSVKPPTKGLPGALHVRREDVIARDKQRQENAAMMPGARAMAERRKQMTAAA